MPNSKITGYTENTTPALTDQMEIVDDPGGSADNQRITLQNLRRMLFPYAACGGRLTLTSGTAVTTSDVTAATSVYFTAYPGSQFCGQIGLYDGSSGWDVINFTQVPLSLAAYTASTPYDIFGYNNSGVLALESTAWTDATTRATALTTQDGVYVKTGATTRRYLGTIYVNSSGGQTDKSALKLFVWNYYNRVLSKGYNTNANAHAYTTAAWRMWNNDASEIIEFVIGVAEQPVVVAKRDYCKGDGQLSGIGYDVTNNVISADYYTLSSGNQYLNQSLSRLHAPTAGYHYYSNVQYGSSNGNHIEASIEAWIWG
jgi:hypothetical protein